MAYDGSSEVALEVYPLPEHEARRIAFEVWASPDGNRSAARAARYLSANTDLDIPAGTIRQWVNRHDWHRYATAGYVSADPRKFVDTAAILLDGAPSMALYLVGAGSGDIESPDRVAVTAAIAGLQLVLGPTTARRDNAADTLRSVVDIEGFHSIPDAQLQEIAMGRIPETT